MVDIKQCIVPEEHSGMRLDQSLAELFPEYSRARLQAWIRSGNVQVNHQSRKPSQIIEGGELVLIQLQQEPQTTELPQPIALQVIHDDEHIVVLDKPAGIVVHPGAGNSNNTLLNGLLYAYPHLEQLPRAGIVHRLDKDTSGVMVVAKSLRAHTSLVNQIQRRMMKRQYCAVVKGVVISGDTIRAPINRHPKDRKKMAVVPGGREAVTHFTVEERYAAHSRLAVRLETGRTHQIRVHMAHIGYPIVGDPVYGGRKGRVAGLTDGLNELLLNFPRQALHAFHLQLEHPVSAELLDFSAPLPDDIESLIQELRADE